MCAFVAKQMKKMLREANIDLERRGQDERNGKKKGKMSRAIEAGRGRHHLIITGYLTITGQWSCYTGRCALQQSPSGSQQRSPRFLPDGSFSTVALANIVLCWQYVFDTYVPTILCRPWIIQHFFLNELLGGTFS